MFSIITAGIWGDLIMLCWLWAINVEKLTLCNHPLGWLNIPKTSYTLGKIENTSQHITNNFAHIVKKN